MQPTSMQKQNNKKTNKFKGGFNMFKTMKKRIKNEKGLTLIELLAVIVILAIVAAIAIPAIGNIIDNSRYNAAKADAVNILNSANLYFTDNPEDTDGITVADLIKEDYLDNAGLFEGNATASVSKVSGGNQLTGTVTYSGEKTVEFNAASIAIINADTQKGSADGNKTIPKPAAAAE